jgi:hypothetical protein
MNREAAIESGSELLGGDVVEPAVEAVDGNWEDVRHMLFGQNRDAMETTALERAIEANSNAAQRMVFGGVIKLDGDPAERSRSAASTRGGTVARAFWWGFHIQFSQEDTVALVANIGAQQRIVGELATLVPGPARPWLGLVGVFLTAHLAVINAVNRGRGVYLSMSWFAPGIFVTTSV